MSETYHMSATGVCEGNPRIDFSFEINREIELDYVEIMWANFIKYVKWKRDWQSEQIRKLVRQTFHREKQVIKKVIK